MGTMKTLVLTSGGIDSTALLCRAKYLGISCAGLYVDYGQPSGLMESKHSKQICSKLGVRRYTMTARPMIGDMGEGIGAHEVPARNLLVI